jgi:hypothetical protein
VTTRSNDLSLSDSVGATSRPFCPPASCERLNALSTVAATSMNPRSATATVTRLVPRTIARSAGPAVVVRVSSVVNAARSKFPAGSPPIVVPPAVTRALEPGVANDSASKPPAAITTIDEVASMVRRFMGRTRSLKDEGAMLQTTTGGSTGCFVEARPARMGLRRRPAVTRSGSACTVNAAYVIGLLVARAQRHVCQRVLTGRKLQRLKVWAVRSARQGSRRALQAARRPSPALLGPRVGNP